jgi:hypothetical protein
MNTPSGLKAVLILFVIILIAGCATHRIDWNSRIGNYTFDQAVKEMGPPDKQAKLSDGFLVVEWVSHYYNGNGAVVGSGYYGYPGGVGTIQVPSSRYEEKLRLTFGTNNVLVTWSKNQ